MKRAIQLVGLSAVLQLLVAGCCNSNQPGSPCAELQKANDELRARSKSLEDGLAAKDVELSGLRAQLADRDAKLADLTNQLAGLQAQPKKVETGPTGFEGTGEVTRKGGAVTVSIPADLLFDSGKAVVKNKGSLPKIASVIKEQYSSYKVHVRGHTDNNPIVKSGWKDNWDLGFNRARAVALQLISDGVSETSVEMDSLADTEPHGGGKAHDRRVDIQVVPPDAGR